jgi:hypothetical protein
MPVETQRRGVVAQLTAARLEDRLGEVLHRLAGMHVHACGQDGGRPEQTAQRGPGGAGPSR